MPDRERVLDETEADAVRCLTEMLDYFCVGEQLRPMKPRREDVVRRQVAEMQVWRQPAAAILRRVARAAEIAGEAVAHECRESGLRCHRAAAESRRRHRVVDGQAVQPAAAIEPGSDVRPSRIDRGWQRRAIAWDTVGERIDRGR